MNDYGKKGREGGRDFKSGGNVNKGGRTAKTAEIGGFSYDKVPLPKSISDIPRFIKEFFGGFFYRLFYIFGIVWETGPWILFSLLFIALISGIMPVVGSIISKEILNEMQSAIVGGSFGGGVEKFLESDVMFLLIFFFIYRILNRVLVSIDYAVTRMSGEKVIKQVKLKIMEKSKDIDLASYDIPEFYERLENANREAGNRPVSILYSTFTMVSTIISFISYIAIVSSAIPFAALCIIAVSIPSAIITFVYRRKNFAYMRHRSKDRRQMNYYSDIMVNKDMVKELRMFDLGDTFIGKYKSVFDGYYRGLRGIILGESIWVVAITVISSIVNCIFYALIAYMVFEGKYMIGDYSLYTNALASISTSVGTLISTSAAVYEGTLFIDNLITFMKTEKTISVSASEMVEVKRGQAHTIEFRNVSFRYPGADRDVLKNISFTLRKGETAVLVGLNGAGKTTLLKLLTRLYDPTEGEILLDGVDLKKYDPQELYSLFGTIFQDFGKYACSVSENVMFGNVKGVRDDERVAQAIKAADADDFVSKLPNSVDTPLMRIFEKTGTELSIGQWQKLAIARAFYSDSDILILDEPTASLDAVAEQEIYNQFDLLRKDKTTIFVSHRLSSATVASKIIVLEYGEVVEEGTHKELMSLKGRYYELFTTQAKRYLECEE